MISMGICILSFILGKYSSVPAETSRVGIDSLSHLMEQWKEFTFEARQTRFKSWFYRSLWGVPQNFRVFISNTDIIIPALQYSY